MAGKALKSSGKQIIKYSLSVPINKTRPDVYDNCLPACADLNIIRVFAEVTHSEAFLLNGIFTPEHYNCDEQPSFTKGER